MKKLLSFVIATVMLISISCTANAYNVSQIIGDGNTVVFVDVPEDYWAKDQIEYFADQGIVDGYEDGSFKPNGGVTREEFCKLLVSTFRAPLETPDDPTFADVPESRWSYAYIEVCKDFMTGYANPFGGLPTFHPEEYATREDIAVALVRMMGFTDADAKDRNYAGYKFKDGGNISPNLVPYVSIACERGLISGYPDGTFGPLKGITRAETVVLLNRATKQAVTNINAELELTADVVYSKDKKTATINIVTEEGATVTVNDISVKMQSVGGKYEGSYVYKFEENGSKRFVVTSKKGSKAKSVEVTASYKQTGPKITISDIPSTVRSKQLSLSGTVTPSEGADSGYYSSGLKLQINGKNVYLTYQNTWSEKIDLKEGENEIVFVASDSVGKTTVKKTVTYVDDGPEIVIEKCPESSETETIEISGTVNDSNHSPYSIDLTINDKEVYVNYKGEWSANFDLEMGENKFVIVAKNPDGKKDTVVKKVTFDYGAPKLTIITCPQTSDTSEVTVYGKVSDPNDYNSGIDVFVNDQKVSYVSYDGKWDHTIRLHEGKNTLKIVAVNSTGKRSEVTKTVYYGAVEPELEITECPENVSDNKVTIKGTMSEMTGTAKLYLNDKNIGSVSADDGVKKWSTTYELEPGENTLVFELINEDYLRAKETKTIVFKVGSPEITFINCPAESKKSSVTIKGKIKNADYLFVDDEECTVKSNGEFTLKLNLEEGTNVFKFYAANDYEGVTVEKEIELIVEKEEEPKKELKDESEDESEADEEVEEESKKDSEEEMEEDSEEE